jgi:hypothetical protein
MHPHLSQEAHARNFYLTLEGVQIHRAQIHRAQIPKPNSKTNSKKENGDQFYLEELHVVVHVAQQCDQHQHAHAHGSLTKKGRFTVLRAP